MKKLREVKSENGAIIVEAIIALTVYIFAVFTILSIVDICYTQARVSVALNSAAKDISKYSYLYYKFGLNNAEMQLNETASESKSRADATLDGIGDLMDAFTDIENADNLEDLQDGINGVTDAGGALGDTAREAANALADDPKEFMVGMAALAGQELVENGKAKLIAQLMGRAFMEKNLIGFEGDTADAFLRRHNVKDGLDELDFTGSMFMHGGESDEILLVVTYDIHVIQLFDNDISFTIKQTAKTKAWGNGVNNAVQSTETE